MLPDLRAFSRFLCRERESADDLVQNTILSALDKQDQFAPGTNLKGWLFTIMRNRFYSDLRTQRRRPTSIDSDTAPMLTAVDNPEATLALKELSNPAHQLATKHCIIISDGDPQLNNATILTNMKAAGRKASVTGDHHELVLADTPHTVWNPVTVGVSAASTSRPASSGESQISAPRRSYGCREHQPILRLTTVRPYRSWYSRPRLSTAALLQP